MKAIINKIEINKDNELNHILVSFASPEGTLTLDSSVDDVTFRRQVFGLLSACGSYDILKIASLSPKPLEIAGYFNNNSLKILENKEGNWLTYSKNEEKYICVTPSTKQRKEIETMLSANIGLEKIKGTIESIKSESGVFSVLFNGGSFYTHFVTNQIYYGFGYPLYIGREEDIEGVKTSSKMFASFIMSLMDFYNSKDLLKLGGNPNQFPEVDIEINELGSIETITNPENGLGLSIKENKIININEKERKL